MRLNGINMVEKKSFFEELVDDKPESFEEEVFVKTKSKKPIYIGLTLVVLVLIFVGFRLLNQVEVPDMSTWQAKDVNVWTRKNNVNLIVSQAYHDMIDMDGVISQDIKAGQKINKKSSIQVVFSKGSDPNVAIAFPDLKKMKVEDIQAWIKENKLAGINIKYENSNSIEKGTVISLEFVDGDASSFVRKNRVKVLVSKGPLEYSEALTMPDLYGKTRKEAVKWAVDNKVNLKIEEDYSDYIEFNNVVSQSIPKSTKFNRTEEVVLKISLGQPIKVPSFDNLTSGEAKELAGLYNLKLFIKSVTSTGEPDRIIYQDIQPGDQVRKDAIVTLHVSKKSDMKKVPLLVGLTKADALDLGKTLGVKISYKMVASTEKNQVVLKQSIPADAMINENEVIALEISDSSIEVVDFTKKTKFEASALAEDMGLKVLFKPVLNVFDKKDTVVKQDLQAGSVVKAGSRIILDIADNHGIKVISFKGMTKEDAEFWARTKGYNLRVIDVYSKKEQKNVLFDQNHKDLYLPKTEPIIVYNSLGEVQVPNMVGETKTGIEKWLKDVNSKRADIKVEYRATTSATYSVGQIVDQMPKKGSLGVDGKIIFYICGAKTSNTSSSSSLQSQPLADFIKWCNNNSISYNIKDVHSSSVKSGYVFGDNINKTVSKGEILNVKKSIGKVPISNFVGKSKQDVDKWLSEVNAKEGQIKVNYITQSGGVKDQVVTASHTSGYLDVAETLTITISSGS